mgnify:CR=1 FL=1
MKFQTGTFYPLGSYIKRIIVYATDSINNPLASKAHLNLNTEDFTFTTTTPEDGIMLAYDAGNEEGIPINNTNSTTPIATAVFEYGKPVTVQITYINEKEDLKTIVSSPIDLVPQQGTSYEITFNFNGATVYLQTPQLTAWKDGVIPYEDGKTTITTW